MSLDEVRRAVLKKAEKEAKEIIAKAMKDAEEIVMNAKREYEAKVSRIKEEILTKVKAEANIRYIRKVVELNMKLTELKNKILNELLSEVRGRLSQSTDEIRKKSLKNLIEEIIKSGIIPPNSKIIIKVVKRDIKIIKELVDELKLTDRISKIEVVSDDFIGGIIVETEDGSIAIDNTYKTRLEKLSANITKMLYEKILR